MSNRLLTLLINVIVANAAVDSSPRDISVSIPDATVWLNNWVANLTFILSNWPGLMCTDCSLGANLKGFDEMAHIKNVKNAICTYTLTIKIGCFGRHV
ncbi:hypothetical protein TcasGA2_TC034207 [Tribolium castaneum]|uniref:Uncharacterized protein n=1 Tax=Tribolium castaneum TaxID=7070 RepID=A0A139WA07_TRICA|nr:hypothetical protein TcasGA2_TC034207 [Tribolium castaneum]